MADLIMILILAASGIIGYVLMAGVDRFIDRHAACRNNRDTETKADEYAETGKQEYSGMPLFLDFKR